MRSPLRTRQRGQFAGAPRAWILSLQLGHSSWDIGLRKGIALWSRWVIVSPPPNWRRRSPSNLQRPLGTAVPTKCQSALVSAPALFPARRARVRAATSSPTSPFAGTTPPSIAAAIPSSVSVATRRARSAGCDQRIASRTMSSDRYRDLFRFKLTHHRARLNLPLPSEMFIISFQDV
jgi:hypothetical protein